MTAEPFRLWRGSDIGGPAWTAWRVERLEAERAELVGELERAIRRRDLAARKIATRGQRRRAGRGHRCPVGGDAAMTSIATVPLAADERTTPGYDLADEDAIAWLRDLGELHGAWLREGFIATRWRRGRPAVTPLIVFAYAELKPRRGGQSTRRRFWYRTDCDGAYGPWDHPIEAVDPTMIRPRQWARQWVGPRCIVLPAAPGWHQHEYGR